MAELGDGQVDVAGLGRQQPMAAAVAVRGAGVGAFVAAGADHLLGFQVDQRLQHELHRLAQKVKVAPAS